MTDRPNRTQIYLDNSPRDCGLFEVKVCRSQTDLWDETAVALHITQEKMRGIVNEKITIGEIL